jgi:hypothetical protein
MGFFRDFKGRWWDVLVVDRRGDEVLAIVPGPRKFARALKRHWTGNWKFWIGLVVGAATNLL